MHAYPIIISQLVLYHAVLRRIRGTNFLFLSEYRVDVHVLLIVCLSCSVRDLAINISMTCKYTAETLIWVLDYSTVPQRRANKGRQSYIRSMLALQDRHGLCFPRHLMPLVVYMLIKVDLGASANSDELMSISSRHESYLVTQIVERAIAPLT